MSFNPLRPIAQNDAVFNSFELTLYNGVVSTISHFPFATKSPIRSRVSEPSNFFSIWAMIVGSTDFIGKFVVKELVNRGFNVIAIAREMSAIRGKNSKEDILSDLNGAKICFSDVTNLDALEKSMKNLGFSIDVVVSCLASRTGGVKDSWKVDYEVTKNNLVAGKKFGASHFVLLSAISVQKPLLEFS